MFLLETDLRQLISVELYSLQMAKGSMGKDRTCLASKNWQFMERKKKYVPNPSNDNPSHSCKQASQNKSAKQRMEHYLFIFSMYRLHIYYVGMIFIYKVYMYVYTYRLSKLLINL